MEKVYLSIVVPVYRGASYLYELVTEIKKVKNYLEKIDTSLEIDEVIFVDDSSIDGSYKLLSDLQVNNTWIRIVQMSRNFGQHAATVAGILHTSGDWVVTMDEDMQHHPKFILPLLRHCVKNNYDVSYADPKSGVHQSIFRDVSYRFFKKNNQCFKRKQIH